MATRREIVNSTPGKVIRSGIQVLLDNVYPGSGSALGVLLDKLLAEDSNANTIKPETLDVLIAKKLQEDFDSFVLTDKTRALAYRKLSLERFKGLLDASSVWDFNQFIAYQDLYVTKDFIKSPHSAKSQAEAYKTGRRLLKLLNKYQRVLRVSCSPIEPSHFVALSSMMSADRHSLPLDLDYASITGVEQIDQCLHAAVPNPPDFLITAVPAYLLRGPHYDAFRRYKLLLELHLEKECVLYKRSFLIPKNGNLVVYKHSAAEEHIRLNPSLSRTLRPEFEESFTQLLSATKHAKFIVAWEPLSTVLQVRGWKSLPNSEHEILIGLFVSSEMLTNYHDIAMMFMDLFLYEWNYCLHNKTYSIARVANHGFREKIAASCGLAIASNVASDG
jgi:hypothetical protein